MANEQDDRFWYDILTLGERDLDRPYFKDKNAYIWNSLLYKALKENAEEYDKEFDKNIFVGRPGINYENTGHLILLRGEEEHQEMAKQIIEGIEKNGIFDQIKENIRNKNSIKISFPTFRKRANFLNFSNCVFPENTKIALPNSHNIDLINFTKCHFHKEFNFSANSITVHFSESIFNEDAYFSNCKFKSAIFKKTEFKSSAYFSQSKFVDSAVFANSKFEHAIFTNSIFNAHVDFSNTTFLKKSGFSKAEFMGMSNFQNTKFGSLANFSEVKFHNTAYFQKSIWEGICNFSKSEFLKSAPEFYGAEIPPDALFTDITLPELKKKSEKTEDYNQILFSSEKSYEYLANVMDAMGREGDKHFFYRHVMRAQEKYGKGGRLPTMASYLYGRLTDYGHGLGRVFSLWLINIFLGAGFMSAVLGVDSKNTTAYNFFDILAQSFSNAHPFLFLRRGWLDTEKGHLLLSNGEKICPTPETLAWLNSIAGIQAVLGVIIFYFLLLTLRNRFKM